MSVDRSLDRRSSEDRLTITDWEGEGDAGNKNELHFGQKNYFKYWTSKVILMFGNESSKEQEKQKKKKKASYESVFGESFDGDFEGDDAHVRIKPEAIETLCKMTKFSRRELQVIYRGFKQECPSGLVKEETFKLIYAQFFPRGADTDDYAHHVFSTFDPNKVGHITFTDFVVGLSALARGTVQDKLRWAFTLYDLDGDGVLSKEELYRIICSIYDCLGRGDPFMHELSARDHAHRVFQRLDINNDGVITIEEFIDSCLRDSNVTNSLLVFNTMF